MLKSAVNSTLSNPYVNRFTAYSREGAYLTGGLDPTSKLAGGGMTYTGFNTNFSRAAGEIAMPTGRIAKTFGSTAFSMGTSALGPGFALYTAHQGYQENGLAGAKDAIAFEIATTSAAARFAYGSVGSAGPTAGMSFMHKMKRDIGLKQVGKKVVLGAGAGMGAGMLRFGGAGIGAAIGQSVGGTAGAFAGAFIGAAPLRFAATHPLLATGMALTGVAAAGAGAVVKGAGAVLRAGASHRRNQRGIDTSGSMAAFMTQNAQTMRSRAVQAMHKSHLNARSALGQEASFLHMPGRNYHSRYR
jgi:hypothetical protein